MDELLIEKVREHDCLYNHRSPDYRDANVRQTAWDKIGKGLKIPGNKAKETWEKLRRCFCNARNRRREETKSGMASKKKSFWKYDEQMSFLIPFLDTRKTHSNLNESQASLTIQPEGIVSESDGEENIFQSEQMNLDEDDEQGAQSHPTASNIKETERNRYETMKNAQKKIRLNTPAHEMVAIFKETATLRKKKYEEKIMGSHSSPTTSLGTLDDMDMFFLSMSRMTKKLPKLEQARIKLELSNSVLSAEIWAHQQISSTPQHSVHSHEQSFCSSPASVSMTSPSDYSNHGDRIFVAISEDTATTSGN